MLTQNGHSNQSGVQLSTKIDDQEKQGHHGGFVLAKPPEEIRFIDILRAVEFGPIADHCLFGLGNCDAQNPCPLHEEWSILKDQIEHWARSHTLGESLDRS